MLISIFTSHGKIFIRIATLTISYRILTKVGFFCQAPSRRGGGRGYFLMVEMNASTSGMPPWKIR